MSNTTVNVTTPASKPTVYVTQDGDVTLELNYNPVGTTSGDVYGPASATDNAIARFDGVTGKVIQNSGITIADGASGTLSGTNTGDQNLFGTIAVAGQSDVVAETTSDTLTLVAGSNITITTDPSTDSITINAADAGVGTVTSVAISGTDGIQVDSGSPITTAGTIQLGVDAPTMKTTLNLAGTNTGDQNVFSTFAVAGQSNVVADSTADTLTLVAGSNITITTDASTDSITINSTASGSGDVVGPTSSTDNALVRFDGTTGKLVQNGQITESDTGDLAAVNSITMDTTPSGSLTTQGQMMWNADEETLDIQLNGFALHVGEHVVFHVKNSTGSTIAKGFPVMFAGTTGNSGKLLIQPWDGTSPSTLFMGLTAESLTDGSEGFVIAFGKLRGIQTNGANYGQTWVDGEIIYAGTTTGSLTKTIPSAPNPIVQVLAVVHAHASNGTYFIRVTNILGDVFGPSSSTDSHLALFDGTTGKVIKDGGTFGDTLQPFDGVNAFNFGATGDAKMVTDAVLNGTTTVTSATAGFTSADVGKVIWGVETSSGIARLAKTTIATYVNSTTITVSAAASGSYTGVYLIWGTDQTAELQAAFAEAKSRNEHLHVPAGGYIFSELPFDANLASAGKASGVVGDGSGSTVFYPTPDYNFSSTTSNTGIFYRVNGNGRDAQLYGLSVQGAYYSWSGGSGYHIISDSGDRTLVEDVRIEHLKGFTSLAQFVGTRLHCFRLYAEGASYFGVSVAQSGAYFEDCYTGNHGYLGLYITDINGESNTGINLKWIGGIIDESGGSSCYINNSTDVVFVQTRFFGGISLYSCELASSSKARFIGCELLPFTSSGNRGGLTVNSGCTAFLTNCRLSSSGSLYSLVNSGTVIDGLANTFGNLSGTNPITPFNYATASTIAGFDASKNLQSLSTSTYPSLTELSYVKGVTSAIQTQIDGKQASDAQLTSLAALSYTGNAGKVVAVNGGENNFELITVGGTGTVTSVAITGTDGIEVDSGSPITGAGTIQLGVNATTMKTTLDLSGTNTGDQNLFGTIAVSGQSNVVADATNDTLTLVAGTNITITTDAATDSITINSTASGSGDVVGPASATDNAIARFDLTTGKLIQNSGITIADGASGTLAGSNSGDVTLSGTPDYITISGQTITRGLIDLATDVTGDLPLANLAQSSAASKLLGRGSASGAGDFQEITIGTGLSMSGTTLSATGGSSNVDVKLYTADDTWTNPSPSTAKRVFIRLVGAGGGGGSGRKGATGEVRCGGGGGASGAVVEYWNLTTELGSTESVTVGAGGTGGASQTTNSSNGSAGTAGGDTIFNGITAKGGGGGGGGTNAAGAAGTNTANATTIGTASSNPPAGGAASATGSAGATGGASVASLPTGGGAGGGITSGNAVASGGAGGAIGNTPLGTVAGGTAGTTGGSGGNGNAGRGSGTGGGGGASSNTTNAGSGGSGGGYGSGGGGGGAATNDVGNSGAGGNGTSGYVLVITYT